MSASEQAASLDGIELFDQLRGAVDERTLAILERRRRTTRVQSRGWLMRRALVTTDLLGLSLAIVVPSLVFGIGGSSHNRLGEIGEVGLMLAAFPAWVVAAKLYGLYDKDEERTDHSTTDDFAGVFQLITVMSWLLVGVTHLVPVASPSFAKVATFWAIAATVIPLGRATGRAFCRRSIMYFQNTVIVGAGDVGQTVARKLLQHPEYGINLVGFVDAQPKELAMGLEHLALLGGTDKLQALVRLFDVERVIIAFSNDSHEETLTLIRDLNEAGVQIDVVPRLFELLAPGFDMHAVEGVPLIGLPSLRLARSSKALKRALDLGLASAALVVLAPFFLLIAMMIKLDSPGPVFFRQVRMGTGDRTFQILKFRSMTADADSRKEEVAHLNKHLGAGRDARMFKIPDDPRVTRVGGWLRRTSLDELPQFLNVVRGQMSLVGPRPLILEEDEYVDEWARRRLDLKPGITGLWQVLGRSDIEFGEMVRLDYLYVTTWSLGLDLSLLVRTLPVLFGGGARVRGI